MVFVRVSRVNTHAHKINETNVTSCQTYKTRHNKLFKLRRLLVFGIRKSLSIWTDVERDCVACLYLHCFD